MSAFGRRGEQLHACTRSANKAAGWLAVAERRSALVLESLDLAALADVVAAV